MKHTTSYKIVEKLIQKIEIPLIFNDLLFKLLPPILDSFWAQISDFLLSKMSNNI